MDKRRLQPQTEKPMIRLILAALVLSFHSFVSAQIIEAYDLDTVQAHLQDLHSETLVCWDVDETLIFPGDIILHSNHEPYRKAFFDYYFKNKNPEELELLKSNIIINTPFLLLDPRSVEIIHDLQARNIPVMALTALRTGMFGLIPCMAEWRYNQLKDHSIDFSSLFPHHSGLEWDQPLTKWDRKTGLPHGIHLVHPVFYKGILSTDGPEKGPVLKEFLNRVEWTPQQVIFIDNEWNYLLSVEQTMKEIDIPFLGIHYRAIERHEAVFDEELVHKQFSHLLEHGLWLSDEKARMVENLPTQPLEESI